MSSWSNDKFTASSVEKMDARSAVAAKLIDPPASVLDVGCGLMLLRKHLPGNVAYEGYDRYPALPEVKYVDLDNHGFPEGHWDYTVLLGVLSWINEKAWTVKRARSASNFMIVTRSNADFDQMITDAGWTLKRSLPYTANTGVIDIRLYG